MGDHKILCFINFILFYFFLKIMYQIAYNELNGMIINLLKVFELYTMKFQNLNFTS